MDSIYIKAEAGDGPANKGATGSVMTEKEGEAWKVSAEERQ